MANEQKTPSSAHSAKQKKRKMTKSLIKRDERTAIKKDQFLKAYFPLLGNIAQICRSIKIDRQTYYNWLKRDKKFRIAIEEEREGMIDFAESKLYKMIDEKNTAAVIFFLKTQAKDRGYIEREEIDHTGLIRFEFSNLFMPKDRRKEKAISESSVDQKEKMIDEVSKVS